MKKIYAIVILLSMGITQMYAQNPFCDNKGNSNAGKLMNFTSNILSNKGEGCSFRFVLWDPANFGWASYTRIEITVDGVDYGSFTLPWGTPSDEVIKLLPSGEVQFSWVGGFNHATNCFEFYNSSNELIYESPWPYGIPDGVFFTYQNECCLPLTGFEGTYIPEANQVNLSWTAPKSVDLKGFDIYRNNMLIDHVAPTTKFYYDNTAGLPEGDYKYCVLPVYPFSCTFEEECYETFIPNSINNYSSGIRIYPNPANRELNIESKALSIESVEIYDVYGRKHESRKHESTSGIIVLNISFLAHGVYFVRLTDGQNYYIQRFIKY